MRETDLELLLTQLASMQKEQVRNKGHWACLKEDYQDELKDVQKKIDGLRRQVRAGGGRFAG